MKHLKVFGKNVELIITDNVPEELMGYYDPTNYKVVIQKKLPKEYQDVTLIHEMVHAAFHRLGFNSTSMSLDTQEIICDMVANLICENFKLTRK